MAMRTASRVSSVLIPPPKVRSQLQVRTFSENVLTVSHEAMFVVNGESIAGMLEPLQANALARRTLRLSSRCAVGYYPLPRKCSR
ncbi:hypothetical protein MPLDJ20_40185 [Mesorhizobium plurifarium]|uniref:Uncharacterized protein n=1 Tax=Mesorhizobium plurifarium TaxID=69974 RepID=A0A090FDQ0_MESPL|nr:hypothetical protein MPLDJ20_40185 [Mesorhizobium plurifarium]